MQSLIQKIDELNERYISVWEDVCNLESPTASKEGVDAVGNYFVAMTKERGWDVEGDFTHSVRERALLSSLAHSAKLPASVAYCI